MQQKYKSLIKNTGILAVSNFASKILVFLLVPLYTSILTTSEYGIYDIVISSIGLVYPILTANIVDGVMRYSMDQDKSKGEVALIGVKYIVISFVIFALGLTAVHFIPYFSMVHDLELLIFAYYFSYVCYQFFSQLAKGMERVTSMAVAGLISTVVMLSTNILFLLVFRWQLKGFFAANFLALMIPAIYLAFSLRFKDMLKGVLINKPLNREMLTYCFPLVFSTIGWWINSAFDKYVVTFMCGIAANGILSVAYKIPGILNSVVGMFGQAWQISAIKEYGSKDSKEFYSNLIDLMNGIMCIGCGVLIIFSKPLAGILYKGDFYAAWQYAPFLLISTVFNTNSGMIGPMLAAKKDSKAMAVSAIVGTVVNVILNIVLVYFIGIQGATIATAISSFVIYEIRRKSVGDALEIPDYYRLICMWILLTGQALLNCYTNLWYLESLILAAVFLLNLSTAKKVLQMLKSYLYQKKRV